MNATDYQATQQAKAFTAAQLRLAYPYLVAAGENESSLTAAAKNIRIELKRAFPKVKFSVTTSRFSMGNSIDVRWTDGPNSGQVDAIVNRYKGGSFDGMTDCYNYEQSSWTDAFGEGKYVTTNRTYSDKMLESVIGRVFRKYGISPIPAAEDYRQGRLWNIRTDNGFEVGRILHRALQSHTYSIEAKS